MKKYSTLFIFMGIFAVANCFGGTYTFESNVGWFSLSPVLVVSPGGYTYVHDFPYVDFAAGDRVTEATLYLSFLGDIVDVYEEWEILGIKYVENTLEFVDLDATNAGHYEDLFYREVDNQEYAIQLSPSAINTINSDHTLKLEIDIDTGYWAGYDDPTFPFMPIILLDYSRISGTAETQSIHPNPVPEPTSLLLLSTGLGVIGLGAWRRRK